MKSISFDPALTQQIRSQTADRIFKKVDTNQDGKITKEELDSALEASGNKQSTSAAEIFKQLDQGSKGYITRQDLEAGLAKAEQGGPAQGPPAKAGGRGAHGGGGDSTVDATDPADLNQDGTVTLREQVEYALKVYAAQKDKASSKISILA